MTSAAKIELREVNDRHSMLPDFPKAKRRANRHLQRAIETHVPRFAPLLSGIAKFRQHEGRVARLVRQDQSEDQINYPVSEFPLELKREHMRKFDQQVIFKKLAELAQAIGEAQTKRLLALVSEGANASGNVVSADGGELTPDMLLEMYKRVAIDFDPKTLEPAPGQTFVMHPDTAKKIVPKVAEWEKDPEFQRKHREVMEQKRSEWRDREADRKLVG